MDSNYLDFGFDDSESDDEEGKMDCLDSEEEEARDNAVLLKMMTTAMPHTKTKKERYVEEFEAEMEMELNRRTQTVEIEGGVEHQKSLKHSSSSSSLVLSSSVPNSPAGSSNSNQKSSSMKNATGSESCNVKGKKNVRFVDSKQNPNAATVLQKDKEGRVYNDIYFDSDDSDEDDTEEIKMKKASRRKFVSNDDLFYDPESDDKDQEWIDKCRKKYFSENAGVKNSEHSTDETKPKPLPNSDAVLNCPACFTVLCLDCQRHDFYRGQYRAMFVMNCVVNREVSRHVPTKHDKYKSRKRKSNMEPVIENDTSSNPVPCFQTESTDTFNPVKCEICNTEVAAFDTDEVYHFFNILTSHT